MEPIRFAAEIRYWNPERASGLAVVDVPAAAVETLGGLKQQRVHGTIGAAAFVSNVMPAGGGRLALAVSKAMKKAAGVEMGDAVDVESRESAATDCRRCRLRRRLLTDENGRRRPAEN